MDRKIENSEEPNSNRTKRQYESPKCKELGNITELTKAKAAGAQDGQKSKILQ
jgi:hypothetical protein